MIAAPIFPVFCHRHSCHLREDAVEIGAVVKACKVDNIVYLYRRILIDEPFRLFYAHANAPSTEILAHIVVKILAQGGAVSAKLPCYLFHRMVRLHVFLLAHPFADARSYLLNLSR